MNAPQLVPSLQHLSCLSIGKLIWKKYQSALRQKALNGTQKLSTLLVDDFSTFRKVRDGSKILPPNSAILGRLQTCIVTFIEHLYSLILEFKLIDRDILRFIDIDNLVLSPFGVADKSSLARSLSNCDAFSDITRFRLACMTCDEELIRNRLTRQASLAIGNFDLANIRPYDLILLYWFRRISAVPFRGTELLWLAWLYDSEFMRSGQESFMCFSDVMQEYGFQVDFNQLHYGYKMRVQNGTIDHEGVMIWCFQHTEYFITNALHFIGNMSADDPETGVPTNLWFSMLCRHSLQSEVALAVFEATLRSKHHEAVALVKEEFETAKSFWVGPTTSNRDRCTTYLFDQECYDVAMLVIDGVLDDFELE